MCRLGPASRKFAAAPQPRPPQPMSPALRSGPSGARGVVGPPTPGAVCALSLLNQPRPLTTAAAPAAVDRANERATADFGLLGLHELSPSA